MFVLGYDVGSSSIKASLLNTETGQILASAGSPATELPITAHQPGWAEQNPQIWWDNIKIATAKIKDKAPAELSDVKAIGISYQMHGLVLTDKNQQVLRDAIIWCDSRAVAIGEKAAQEIGTKRCLENMLNYPGNFTASKIKWVMDNEPEIFARVHKAMLPGDYIAMKMTHLQNTTPSGLSEGIMWDFQSQKLASIVTDYYQIPQDIICDIVPTFSVQGELTFQAAEELGLNPGIVVSYRGGDQPNNALSLNVLQPGEIAATAGTSGVVNGITDKHNYDPLSRVNTFVHVNHTPENPRYSVLVCLNGTGILYSWLKHNLMGPNEDYPEMNDLAHQAPPGAEGLMLLPFGNGAERILENRDLAASVHGWNFNTHRKEHFLRAAQEGIAFGLNFGLDIMRQMNIEVKTVRAGHANMFLSDLFSSIFASVTETTVELYNTDGSQGAARGAALGAGIYKNQQEMFTNLKSIRTIEPDTQLTQTYKNTYQNWLNVLKQAENNL